MPTRPFIPVFGVFKVQLIYSYQGQRIENVFNVKSGGALLVADADRIFGVVANWYTNVMRNQTNVGCLLSTVVLDALDSASGLHREYVAGWTAPGIVNAAGLPGSVTSSVKLATGLRGRSFRGRFYWPALTQSQTLNGQLTNVVKLAIEGSLNTLRTSLAASTPSDVLVVVSYRTNGIWRNAGVATPVTNASAHLNLDSQRRRLPGRGL